MYINRINPGGNEHDFMDYLYGTCVWIMLWLLRTLFVYPMRDAYLTCNTTRKGSTVL